jgi:hypothetical protein
LPKFFVGCSTDLCAYTNPEYENVVFGTAVYLSKGKNMEHSAEENIWIEGELNGGRLRKSA